MPNDTQFKPDWVSPPGDTISAILCERGLSHNAFAEAIRWEDGDVRGLLDGQAAITDALARQLAEVLGATATFWAKREARYREDLTRLEQLASSQECLKWLLEIPAKEMVDFGWISPSKGKSASAATCLQFFGVSDVDGWRDRYHSTLETITFRTSKTFPSDPGAVTAWLRQGERLASELQCAEWSPEAFRSELERIRPLTREKDPAKFLPELVRRCTACGVAVVLLRAPKQCKASGAAFFMTSGTPLLLLSGRHLSDDHFWFSFYHEAGHLLLHGTQSLFVDGLGGDDRALQEEEANQFASDLLVPPEFQSEMLRLTANQRDVMRFAMRIGVSRGVVVGQLQHRKIIGQDKLNHLKHRFKWNG